MKNLMAQEKWVELARKLLKKELKKKQMTYEMLREALNSIGVHQTLSSINTKMMRGTFSASFFIACLAAMNIKHVSLKSLITDIAVEEPEEYSWSRATKDILKKEMMKKGLSVLELSKLLNQHGSEKKKAEVSNFLSRGTFSAAFLIECLVAMNVSKFSLDEDFIKKAIELSVNHEKD